MAAEIIRKSYCEDYPACGHGPEPYGDGGGCPDAQGRFNCVNCGKKMKRGETSAICQSCHTRARRRSDEGDNDPYDLDRSFGIASFVKAFGKKKKTDENYPSSIKADAKFWDKKADCSHNEDRANETKKSVFGMAKFEDTEKSHHWARAVPAGTRPFARRALPKTAIKQTRASAPRYGITKGFSQTCGSCKGKGCNTCGKSGKITGNATAGMRGGQKMRLAGNNARTTPGHLGVHKSCENCGVGPALSKSMPLCKKCIATAVDLEKGRKRTPIDRIMRLEEGNASEHEARQTMQGLVNSGDAWHLQGSYGRSAMDMIRAGHIALGHQGHRDYYGNYVPSRHEVAEGTKGHASFVRAAGYEPDKCGKDCPSPEVPDKLPKTIRNKKISKGLYVRVPKGNAKEFLKSFKCGTQKCGFSGNALQVLQHKKASHPLNTRMEEQKNAIKKSYPEMIVDALGNYDPAGQAAFSKSIEFKLLDENDPEYHGHTGGGAGYNGTKWVHMHGPVAAMPNTRLAISGTPMAGAQPIAIHPKEDHRHFKMGSWTTHHSPSGYRESVLGGVGENEMDAACVLPHCGHPYSQHLPTDAGPMGCTGCNDKRPRRNVRHEFRSR